MPGDERERIEAEYRVEGAVQGVGFRPFVYRLAHAAAMDGWVRNDVTGVTLGLVGARAEIDRFLRRLRTECPAVARVDRIRLLREHPPRAAAAGFRIVESGSGGRVEAVVTPDLAICADCLRELRDPRDRRHRYPMLNCAHCGPRYSIMERLPYDRANTTMRRFPLCPRCAAEYGDPLDRRHHAEAIACPVCGPTVALWDRAGAERARGDEALAGAIAAVRSGRIVAVKGLGGFHLMADMRDGHAVRELRRRKRREEKPFALMLRGMGEAEACCELSAAERAAITSFRAPIVLAMARPGCGVVPEVAPGNPRLGVMLPYTPLHHLLLDGLDAGVVATSGNLSEEPICTDEREAVERLGAIADLFLVHDRPIARPLDDSVVQIVAGEEMVLRCARGYAPMPVDLGVDLPPLLAVGAHLKSAVAVTAGTRIMLGQHVGDLETAEARAAFEGSASALRALFAVDPRAVAHDLHPDYASTLHARRLRLPTHPLQHHAAHVFSCLAEARAREVAGVEEERWWRGRVLGVSFDGTGHGTDGTVWGGEFLDVDDASPVWRRVAHLMTFPLPGGEHAVRDPARCALGTLWEIAGDEVLEDVWLLDRLGLDAAKAAALVGMMRQGVNSPRCSSAGRLFDAAAALSGARRDPVRFEGQAAMALEHAAGSAGPADPYPLDLAEDAGSGDTLVVDWRPLLGALVADARRGIAPGPMAWRFHAGLAEAIRQVAQRFEQRHAVLTGGCFQNRLLLRLTAESLSRSGIEPHWNRRVPINDGGIAVGQAYAAGIGERQSSEIGDSG